jgi:hypothetical protein
MSERKQKHPWEIKPDNWVEMTQKERMDWMIARAPPHPATRPVERNAELKVEVSPKIAQSARDNPSGVRVAVSGDPGVFERVRPTEIIQVREVDRQGRPHLIRRVDLATGTESMIEMDQGYRPQPGAVHEYDPLQALK